jgi:hypothetical protein
MSSRSSRSGDATRHEASPPPARLHVEVPHWAATVGVYDKRLQPVAGLSVVRQSQRAKGVYEAVVELPPGIYDVEVALADRSQRQFTAVFPGQTSRIDGDTWKLGLSSAAPLEGTDTSQATHRTRAETWSRRTTWTQAPGGDSRLFLFVRTMEPKRHPNFSDGLFLLDADGAPVTSFDDGTRKSAAEGWLAFTAELPAGYYMLRRGRRGVRVRYQAIYLCAGWETHAFLVAGARPIMGTMTLSMAPLGAGFRADDDTAVAAEAIMAGLRRATDGAPITGSERLVRLVRGTRDNPWLSILAAYSLLRTRERLAIEGRWSEDSELADLQREVRKALEPVDGHPDARAVRLQDDEPAPAPFWHPPLLRMGLLRVQRHATRHASTVPLDSLTDRVLDNQVANSPWTAWRVVDPLPQPEHAVPTNKPQMLDLKKAAPAPADPALAAAFVQAGSPMAPVFRLDDELDADGAAAATPEPTAVDRLLTASVLKATQELGRASDATGVADKVPLDLPGTLGELLDPVKPEAVSASCGVSLARAEDGLKRLRRRGADAPSAAPEQPPPALNPGEQAVLTYALQSAAQTGSTAALAAPAADAVASPAPPVTIEDLVATLRTEADRLLLRDKDDRWRSDGGDPVIVRELGMRLRRVADNLLGRTDFIAMADGDDHLVYGNGPFLDLVLPPVDEPAARPGRTQRRKERHDNRQAWEAALAGASLGHSSLPAPAPNRVAETWELWRTVIEDDTDGRPHAYLNVLRREGVDRPAEGMLERAEALLSELKQYTPLVAYGSAEHRTEYTQRVEALTGELENAVSAHR